MPSHCESHQSRHHSSVSSLLSLGFSLPWAFHLWISGWGFQWFWRGGAGWGRHRGGRSSSERLSWASKGVRVPEKTGASHSCEHGSSPQRPVSASPTSSWGSATGAPLCPEGDCQVRQRPDFHRRAQLPRTFSFNKVVCLDFLYVPWRELNIAIFNMVDLGTGFQVAIRAPIATGTRGGTPTAETAWRVFLTTWVRHYGAPQLIICDAGNEFKGHFERSLENMGILQHVIHPEAPWENGKAERHGGWLKNRLDREIQSGRSVIQSLEDLDELLSSLTATKNNWLNKGGFSPSQLVFGQMCRIPGELLAEDDLSLHGLQDAFEDPMEVDEAAGEYRRRHRIRERARQLAMEQCSKEAIHQAQHAAPQQSRRWVPGQWVYVFRRAKAAQELHLRNRWVGPGLVVLDNNGTTYVAMRSRLWRCSSSQLRAALPSEVLGKDLSSDPGLAALLQRVVSGARSGAVDVAKEGPPPADGSLAPVERVEDGVQMGEALPTPAPTEAVQHQAPRPHEPVPPGILPTPSRPSEMEDVTGIAPSGTSEASVSRRSSTNEPLSEPDETGLPSSAPPPGLGAIHEEEEEGVSSGSEVREPLTKMPRTAGEGSTALMPEPPATSSASSSAEENQGIPSQADETLTRAPGTPVRQLLERVVRPGIRTAHRSRHRGEAFWRIWPDGPETCWRKESTAFELSQPMQGAVPEVRSWFYTGLRRMWSSTACVFISQVEWNLFQFLSRRRRVNNEFRWPMDFAGQEEWWSLPKGNVRKREEAVWGIRSSWMECHPSDQGC